MMIMLIMMIILSTDLMILNSQSNKLAWNNNRSIIIVYILISDTKDGKTISLSEQVDSFDEIQRPLWFVYSGMGSQWPGMGKQLMRLPIFAEAIERYTTSQFVTLNFLLKCQGFLLLSIFSIVSGVAKFWSQKE